MALFRTLSSPEPLPPIAGQGVVLRMPQITDYQAWADLRETSRKFLTPWEPTWPADDLTRPAFRQRIRRYVEDVRTDQAYPFFAFRQEDNALVGALALANIRRGYMTAAVRALIPVVFDVLRLHRLEAACIPTNLASIRLLEKTGFRREGYARGYLCINGTWQDHLLYARLQSDPRE
jgi:ribosomal-protein-alanine N-acetyltransferase